MINFSIIIPVYNESENINPLLNEILISLKNFDKDKYEIIFVDDCSTDNTVKIIKEKEKNKNIKGIFNFKNVGQSYSIHKGVINSKFENIITLDGDGQNDPLDFQKLIDIFFLNNKYSLVSGIRINRQDSLIKVLSSKIANKIRSNILNDNCPDTGCSLKIFKKNIFLKFPLFEGLHRLLPALFIGYGNEVFYVPVSHRPRVRGLAKYGTFDRLFKGIKHIILVKKIINNIKSNK